MHKLRNLLLAVFAIWVAGGIAGAILGGIGFWGVMAVVLATAIAIGIFSSFPCQTILTFVIETGLILLKNCLQVKCLWKSEHL